MIARLRGALVEAGPEGVVVDVNGVGYRLFAPDSTLSALPLPGEEVTLYVHTYVREDAIQLYGFGSKAELRLFETVLGVDGVGPRLALAILSHTSVDGFVRAVLSGDERTLTRIPGIGKKTAARILLELKDKLNRGGAWQLQQTGAEGPPPPAPGGVRQDVVGALLALGYREEEAAAAAEAALAEVDPASTPLERLITRALRKLDRR